MPVNAVPQPGERLLERQPVAVQKTIRAQLGNGRLRSVDAEEEDGEVTYDVEMVRDGRTRSISVAADGRLLDAEVFLEELPAVVREAIKKKAGTSTLGEIDKSVSDDGASYDVEIIGGGKTRTLTIDQEGKLTSEEIFLAELPESFQTTVQKEIGKGTLEEITRSLDSGEILYDVDLETKGGNQTLTFDSKGTLLSKEEEIGLTAVPESLQKQIQTLSARGKLVTISKVTENDNVSFDVDIRVNGKVISYTIGANGKLVLPETK